MGNKSSKRSKEKSPDSDEGSSSDSTSEDEEEPTVSESVKEEDIFWDDRDIDKCFLTPKQLEGDGSAGWVETIGIYSELFLTEIADDLVVDTKDELKLKEKNENPPFKMKEFKKNFKRVATPSKSISNAADGLCDILHWKYPVQTFSFACLYFYASWMEYLIPAFLFLLLAQILVNYLSEIRGISLGLYLIPIHCATDASNPVVAEDDSKKKRTFADRINEGASKGEAIAEILHKKCAKINKFFKWEKRSVSSLWFFALLLLFAISIYVTTSSLVYYLSTGVGIYLFSIKYLLFRFPKLHNIFKRKTIKIHSIKDHNITTEKSEEENNL